MTFEALESWLPDLKHPLVIAGPCSAESEEQVLATAQAVASVGHVRIFRAGVWKPRTRPGGFEGLGPIALPWVAQVKAATGLLTCTEVARTSHVEQALEHGIDVLWVGARSTSNPFTVQELADALRGVDVPVMVKNPISPDVGLWLGGIERLAAAGLDKLVAVHRGFAIAENYGYRNPPVWRIPIELMRRLPGLPVICDPSHITGDRRMVPGTAQAAMDLGMQGLMVETHSRPDKAWTDAPQQLDPEALVRMLDGLVLRRPLPDDPDAEAELAALRRDIDEVDGRLVDALAKRMDVVRRIGAAKNRAGIAALQLGRINALISNRSDIAESRGLSPVYVEEIFRIIHEAALKEQMEIMSGTAPPDDDSEA